MYRRYIYYNTPYNEFSGVNDMPLKWFYSSILIFEITYYYSIIMFRTFQLQLLHVIPDIFKSDDVVFKNIIEKLCHVSWSL